MPITEKWCFSEWNPDELWKIIDRQKEIVEEIKRKGYTNTLPGIAVIINDFADDSQVLHTAAKNPITSSFLRARHWAQSTYVVSQNSRASIRVCESIALTCAYEN